MRRRPAWWDSGLAPYGLLTGLAVLLALARLLSGPWLHLYNPAWGLLLEGQPAEWEVVYYLQQFPTLGGDGAPLDGFAAVHQRALLELYVASGLHAWTGSAYWSLALVDLLGWAVAGIATLHLGLRLGLGRWPATAGAVLVVTSPLFASQMWMHVFHPAEFASLPVGLWAAVKLMDGAVVDLEQEGAGRARAVARLAGLLGLVLFGMSLAYQYQWVSLPVLGAAALSWPESRWRGRLGLVASLAGAVVVLGVALLAFRGLLLLAGVPQGGSLEEAVSRPEALAMERLRDGGILALLPHVGNLRAMAAVYHPLVFGIACLGLVWVPWRVRWMALAATATTLVAHAQYSAPWTAMSAYPLMYLAAGVACSRGGQALRQVAGRRGPQVAVAAALLLLVLLAGVTNGDLWGDAAYARWWWSHYALVPRY